MSVTLARRIRRIGLLPTTVAESKETRLVKNEEGNKVEKEFTIRKQVRNREPLTLEELTERRLRLIAAARAQRKGTTSVIERTLLKMAA